jgi:long-subunit acyl-CoA synthetase (AMP-forming)
VSSATHAPTTVCELFQRTVAERGDSDALRTRGGEVTLTWREYGRRVRDLAAGLATLGLARGETLALMLVNRPEFHLADLAALHLGAVPFSLYNSSSADQVEHLLADSGAKIVITEQAFLPSIERARQACPSIEHVFVVDERPSLADLEQAGAADFDFDDRWRAVQPSDLLTLIYTSGTTGPPKGVQITHANYLAELRAFAGIDDFKPGRLVSYFPMAHIAERVVSHYNAIAYGHTVTCCPDPKQVMAYLPEVRPTFFFAVPRIWEKVRAALEAGIANEPDRAKRLAIGGALELGLRRVRAEQAGERVSADLAEQCAGADEAVFSPIRTRLGLDRAEHILTGAAPSPVDVLEFFHAIGIEILEVWGLSETTGLATANLPGRAKLGTVGPAAAGVELRLADDGEVHVRGGIVMAGYRGRPEKTAEAIDEQGWFRTGDVGTLDDDGCLRIVDRKKEIMINAAGENMSPANIEAQVKGSSTLIGQACVIGDRRPYNVALIVLDPDSAATFAQLQRLPDDSLAALAHDDAVIEEIRNAVERANMRLSRPEQIKRFRVLGADWEAAGAELTPTLKLKRSAIEQKYADVIEALYAETTAAPDRS